MKKTSSALKYCVLISALLICALTAAACVPGLFESFEALPQALLCLLAIVLLWAVAKLVYTLAGKSETRLIVIAAAVTLLARVLFVLFIKTYPDSDFEELFAAARELSQGGRDWLQSEYFRRWPYQIPFVLYEAGVYALFRSALALKLFGCIFMTGTGVLVYKLSRLFASKEGAFTAAMLYALCPEALFLAPILTNQHISLFFIMLGLFVALRDKRPAAAILGGALIAIGNLMRPEAVIAVGALAAAELICFLKNPAGRKNELLCAVLTVAAYAGAMLLVRLILQGADLAPYGLGNNCPEWKFVVGLNPETTGGYDLTHGAILEMRDGVQRRAAAREVISGYFGSAGDFFAFLWEKIKLFYGEAFDYTWTLNYLDLTQETLAGVTLERAVQLLAAGDRMLYAAVTVLAGAGIARAVADKREVRGAYLTLAAVLCLFFAAFLLIEIQPRYRYFILPTLYALAAGTLPQAKRRAHQNAL